MLIIGALLDLNYQGRAKLGKEVGACSKEISRAARLRKKFLGCEFLSRCFGTIFPKEEIALILVKWWDLFADG